MPDATPSPMPVDDGDGTLISKARRYAHGAGVFSRAQIGHLAEMCARVLGEPEPGVAVLHGLAAQAVVDAGLAEWDEPAGNPDLGLYHRVRWTIRLPLDQGIPDPLHSLVGTQRDRLIRAIDADDHIDTPSAREMLIALRTLYSEVHWYHALAIRGQAYRLGMEFFQEMATVLASSLLGDDDDGHDLGAWVLALPPEKRNVLAQLLDALDVDLSDLADLAPSTEPKVCVPVPCPEPETVEITGVVRLEDGAVFSRVAARTGAGDRKPWTFDVQFEGGPQIVDYGTGTEWDGSHHWAIYDGPHEIDDVVIAGAADDDPTAVLTQIVAEHNACICPPPGSFVQLQGGDLTICAPTGGMDLALTGVTIEPDDKLSTLMDNLAESVDAAKESASRARADAEARDTET